MTTFIIKLHYHDYNFLFNAVYYNVTIIAITEKSINAPYLSQVYLLIDSVGLPNVKNKVFETEGTPTYKSVSLQELNGDKEYKIVVQGRTCKGFGKNSTDKVVIATPFTGEFRI